MTRDLRNHIKKCSCCRKYEAAPPVVPMKPLACSGPGELLHVDFMSIEETVPLKEDPVIHNVLVLQDHFSKYVVAYVVKDQTACTAAKTLRIGYFGLLVHLPTLSVIRGRPLQATLLHTSVNCTECRS